MVVVVMVMIVMGIMIRTQMILDPG